MSQYIKIKESQMESPMKNMPCHEDPKQRNVGQAESHFSKSNFFSSTFFNRVGQPQPVITLGNHSVRLHPTSSDMQR